MQLAHLDNSKFVLVLKISLFWETFKENANLGLCLFQGMIIYLVYGGNEILGRKLNCIVYIIPKVEFIYGSAYYI